MSQNLIQDVKEILVRDLGILAVRVENTPESQLWEALPGVINPVGTLALHLCGNLRHFIGQVLGHDGYIRNRDAEFAQHYIPKQQLLAEIQETRESVLNSLNTLHALDLSAEMPDTPPQHQGRSIGFFLIQLCCHLSWHRGQADYLARILSAK